MASNTVSLYKHCLLSHMKKLLCVFAHPDDESFTAGGTIAKYVKAGWAVDLICGTRGEAGDIGSIRVTKGDALGEVREAELREAGKVLGLSSITFLPYKDGTLSTKVPGDIEEALINKLKEIKPDVVITFETGGISNHPDHIKLSYATTYAFQEYAKMRRKAIPNDENPPKLYYACVPESVCQYLIGEGVFPAEAHDRPWRGVEDKKISTVIDIKRFASVKEEALRKHMTQEGDVDRYYSIDSNILAVQEYYMLRMVGITEAFVGKNDRVSDGL